MPAPKDPKNYAMWIERQSVSQSGKVRSDETLKKMSGSQIDIPKPPRSQEHCKNISKSKIGEKNPMFGTHPVRQGKYNLKCPKCGSVDVKGDGSINAKGFKEQITKCKNCGYKSTITRFDVL